MGYRCRDPPSPTPGRAELAGQGPYLSELRLPRRPSHLKSEAEARCWHAQTLASLGLERLRSRLELYTCNPWHKTPAISKTEARAEAVKLQLPKAMPKAMAAKLPIFESRSIGLQAPRHGRQLPLKELQGFACSLDGNAPPAKTDALRTLTLALQSSEQVGVLVVLKLLLSLHRCSGLGRRNRMKDAGSI